MYADFERFTIRMTGDQALSASHPGPCDEDVKALLQDIQIELQLDQIGADEIRAELKEYGAWDDAELSDNQANQERIVWLAACDIRDTIEERTRS